MMFGQVCAMGGLVTTAPRYKEYVEGTSAAVPQFLLSRTAS